MKTIDMTEFTGGGGSIVFFKGKALKDILDLH